MRFDSQYISFFMFFLLVVSKVSADEIPPEVRACEVITMIVPGNVGGGTDIIFRLIVEALGKKNPSLTFRVENIPGRGGVKGTSMFIHNTNEAGDACYLLAIHQSLITAYLNAQSVIKHTDVWPLAQLVSSSGYFVASKKAPFKTFEEFKIYVKANPNEVVAASTLGSVSNYFMINIEKSLGIKLRHVFYDGASQRVSALLNGTIDVSLLEYPLLPKNEKLGTLNILAYAGRQPSIYFPRIKTLESQGLPVYGETSRGVALSLGLNESVINFYQKLFQEALTSKELREKLGQLEVEADYLGGGSYFQRLDSVYRSWLLILYPDSGSVED